MKKGDGVALSISMIAGISVGAILGYFTALLELFIGVGLAAGLIVGFIIERKRRQKI